MKFTKEQLHAMSDMQVLRKLYELLGFEVHEYEFEEVITIRHGDKVTTAEMCPNDIMPLAFGHHLTIHYVDNGCEHKWFATKPYSPEHFHDTNPLRAIACCLILVLQGER